MSFSKWKLPKYEKHRAELERRGISVKTAERRGYEPLTAEEMRKATKIAADSIAITCYKADGTPHSARRYCIIDPEARKALGRKYHQRSGTGSIIHHRRAKGTKYKRVIITEGEFKADKLHDALGAWAISLPGVDSFRLDGKLHPELAAIPKNTTVEFCYDTDQRDNPRVRRRLLELADLFAARGNKVKFREIYSVTTIEKTGADDFLQHYGAEAYEAAPLHDLDSPTVKGWREQLAKDGANNQLPAALRGLQPFDPDWYAEPPPAIDHICGYYLHARETALLVGEAGCGKTYFALQMHACIGTGHLFFKKWVVPRPRKSLYIMCERAEVSLRRRWYKVVRALASGIEAEGDRKKFERLLHANCYLKAIPGESLRLIEYKNNEWIVSPAVDALIQELLAAGIEVIFLDPLSRLHGGNENDAAVAAMITKALERIVQLAGCSVVLVHHSGKSVRGDQYSGRGSSAFNDNTSECIVLTKVEDEERGKLELGGLPTDDPRADIVRVHHARSSDGRPAGDMYLARSTATGLLHERGIERKSKDDLHGEKLEALRAWAEENGQVSRRMCADNHNALGLSERAAEALFDAAVVGGALVPDTDAAGKQKKRGGGGLFVVSSDCGTEAPLRRRSATVPQWRAAK